MTVVGIPKEIKKLEHRVGLRPGSVADVVRAGHTVLVQAGAATAIGFTDEEYTKAGATIVQTAAEIFEKSDLIVKVKEPQAEEWAMLRPEQTLFTYLHLAPDPLQAKGLQASGCTAIAYETVTDSNGRLPLLTPMSEVAGRMAIQAGAHALEMTQGGRGLLLGGVPGVEPATVMIIGGGVVGSNAARIAVGMGARTVIMDTNPRRLAELDNLYTGRLTTVYATQSAIDRYLLESDLVIGAVLVPGASAPRVVTKAHLSAMRTGSVLVDVSIDQGGCFETSRPTTHDTPTYVVDGVIHYCVANMPGGVARTSTIALNNATLPFVLALANKGTERALAEDVYLRNGLNVQAGQIKHPAVIEALKVAA